MKNFIICLLVAILIGCSSEENDNESSNENSNEDKMSLSYDIEGPYNYSGADVWYTNLRETLAFKIYIASDSKNFQSINNKFVVINERGGIYGTFYFEYSSSEIENAVKNDVQIETRIDDFIPRTDGRWKIRIYFDIEESKTYDLSRPFTVWNYVPG